MEHKIKVFSNRDGRSTIRSAFESLSSEPKNLLFACPFFTNSEIIFDCLKKSSNVKLLVRLCESTDPDALYRIMQRSSVQVRFFTSRLFHSKLYIFGEKTALIGSANLTDAGVQSNQEICVTVDGGCEAFDELVTLFSAYWEEAEVLTKEKLAVFLDIRKSMIFKNNYDAQIQSKLGDVRPKGIRVDKNNFGKEKAYLKSYEQTYQEFLAAFKILDRIYSRDGRRMQPEKIVPLRIEIDMFLSYIRDNFAGGDVYERQPYLFGENLEANLIEYIGYWHSQRWQYLDDEIPDHYAAINATLGTKESIENATIDQLLEALLVCHSFADRFRFYKNGTETMKRAFIAENSLTSIQNTLSYLLHGEENFIKRMAACIFDDKYKLNHFGRSNVQELFGWVNRDNIPICNGRTVKSLRYLGFNVKIFN